MNDGMIMGSNLWEYFFFNKKKYDMTWFIKTSLKAYRVQIKKKYRETYGVHYLFIIHQWQPGAGFVV